MKKVKGSKRYEPLVITSVSHGDVIHSTGNIANVKITAVTDGY